MYWIGSVVVPVLAQRCRKPQRRCVCIQQVPRPPQQLLQQPAATVQRNSLLVVATAPATGRNSVQGRNSQLLLLLALRVHGRQQRLLRARCMGMGMRMRCMAACRHALTGGRGCVGGGRNWGRGRRVQHCLPGKEQQQRQQPMLARHGLRRRVAFDKARQNDAGAHAQPAREGDPRAQKRMQQIRQHGDGARCTRLGLRVQERGMADGAARQDTIHISPSGADATRPTTDGLKTCLLKLRMLLLLLHTCIFARAHLDISPRRQQCLQHLQRTRHQA